MPTSLSSKTHPPGDDDHYHFGLSPTEEVFEAEEDHLTSRLLDQYGKPIVYQSRKLGYIGFTRLTQKD